MREPVYTEEVGPFVVKIFQDDDHDQTIDDSLDPTWAFLHCFHKRYKMPHNEDLPGSDAFDSWDAMDEFLSKKHHTFKVSMYDHGGTTVKLGSFSCQWDSGQIGFVCVPRRRGMTRKRAEKIAQSVVSEWDDLMTGNVWGFTIDEKIGEDEYELKDSCWGFVGLQDLCLKEAQAMVRHFLKPTAQDLRIVERFL